MDEGVSVPEELRCGEQVFDLDFHPHSDVLGTSLIDGRIQLHRYASGDEGNEKVMELHHHTSSCRGIHFSEDGQSLFSISSDRSWAHIDSTGQMVTQHHNAHQASINKLLLVDNFRMVTGDDSGVVKLWDPRVKKETAKYHLHEDYISDFTFDAERQTLLSVGGDATLCVYDLRKGGNESRSDDQESEMLSVQCIKGGRKVISGTQDGVVLIFSWDRWGDCSDRFPGHPQAVDCMLKVDESSVITGSSDGLIRVVSIQPNKVLGVIGDHEDFPVEGLSRSRCGNVLGSYSHDDMIRFWDVSMFVGDVDDDDGDVETGEDDVHFDSNARMDEEEDSWEDISETSKVADSYNAGDTDSSDSDNDGHSDHMFKSDAEKFYEDL